MNILEKLGIKIGHYTDLVGMTGATVIIPDHGADIGIDIRGSDTGSFNIPAYEIKGASKLVRAIVLTGGSTAGLECAIGVIDYLNTPNVVGAVIYDRKVGKDVRPHLKDGYQMAASASYSNFSQGNVGVGTGATTGKWNVARHLKGGFGIHIQPIQENAYVGAFVVTNAVGDVINPDTNEFYSECGKYNLENYYHTEANAEIKRGTNTTLAVIVTNIEMNREELMKVSELAQDGMARAIYPVHTNRDGDVIFSISPHSENRVKLDMDSFDLVNYVGIVASNALMKAINSSIVHAESIDCFPSFEDLKKEK